MAGDHRRDAAAATALLAGILALAGCGGGAPASTAAKPAYVPQRILAAPKGLLSAAEPQRNGMMWTLAGGARSRGLFELDSSDGRLLRSISVSDTARSVAQTPAGLIGLGLGAKRAGALELLGGRTAKPRRVIPLPAPARQVVAAGDGGAFYVLTTSASAESVSVVESGSGRIRGTVPVPRGTVSIAPDARGATLYTLQRNGLLDQIGIADGKIRASFRIGDSGASLALSPDGATLYALKDTGSAANVAVVDAATESVRRALPAPAGCLQVLMAPGGHQLYDVVGTPAYGNVQIFPV